MLTTCLYLNDLRDISFDHKYWEGEGKKVKDGIRKLLYTEKIVNSIYFKSSFMRMNPTKYKIIMARYNGVGLFETDIKI